MKRVLILVVALVAMVAFPSGVMAQAPAKTTGPAPEKAAPAPAPKAAAEKAKAGKPKVLKAAGTVAAYDATGKTIAVKMKGKEMKFDIAANAKVKGEIKEGAKVSVTYKKDGDKMVATSISRRAPKKEAPKQKEAPKK